MHPFIKQRIVVIGAAGQVGTPLTQTLLELGHEVVALTRSRNSASKETLDEFESNGAEIIEIPDMLDLQSMTSVLKGADSLVCASPASDSIINEYETVWLEAAVAAGVKRFVPTEFGCHTRSLDYGDGILFDHKKRMHEKIFASGIGWTFIYNGVIFDYCLPNLRFFRKITTFGKMDIPIYTHEIADIGRIAAYAITDERTMNKCVQLDYNSITQTDMLSALRANFPDYPFEYEHYSTEFITQAMQTASDKITGKKGKETDKERWGINNVIYVLDKLAGFTDETLRASELYPDYQVSKTPVQALSDPDFVFEQ